MGALRVRRMLTPAILAAFALSSAPAQVPKVQNFQTHITAPAYTGLPVWIYAELTFPLEIRYPYGEDPEDFGSNKLELKRENHVLEQVPFKPWVGGGGGSGGSGIMDGSIAPPNSPKNRLPLHLQYELDKAGTYSVRWTVVRHDLQNGKPVEIVVAQSDWLQFEVRPSTQEQRSNWFEERREKIPSDVGQLLGDFLPSILAVAPDRRALQVVLGQMYSTEPLISGCALGSLRFFRDEDIRAQVMDILRLRGPNEGLAYVISWHPHWFEGQQDDIVRTVMPYLHSREDWQVAASLKMLGFLFHVENFHWPTESDTQVRTDSAVLAAAPELIGRSSQVSQELAEYLGSIKKQTARDFLWQIAESPEPSHEQALIALTWIGESQDLPRLAELLVKPGDADTYGRDLAVLPYQLLRAYGDSAIPYVERALSDSPYPFVKTQSAEELALRGRPSAFRFFLDAVEENRFYKPELVGWLKTQFAKELLSPADDPAIIAFLRARLHS